MTTDAKIASGIAIVVGLLAANSALRPNAPSDMVADGLPTTLADLDGAVFKQPLEGPGPVVLEFADFQCPFCRQFVIDVLPTLETKYIQTQKLAFAFVHFPLERIHPDAIAAARAADCAGAQGRFWPMHDKLFTKRGALDSAVLRTLASSLALNGPRFDQCMSLPTSENVGAGNRMAALLKVKVTPTFFFGRRNADGQVVLTQRLEGAAPIAAFESAARRIVDK